jgi:hypothetical protein
VAGYGARGDGLRVRLARIPGVTPRDLLPDPIVLPAVMNGFSWTEEAYFSEYDTVADGQFAQPAMGPTTARRLRVIDDVEALTIWWDAPWLVDHSMDPEMVYAALFGVLRSRKPIELLATPQLGKHQPLLRADVTIRSIQPQLRQHEPDSVYYTLRISEDRRPGAGRRGEGRGSHLPTTHKLTATDTLHSLAEHYYHSAHGWSVIAQANGLKKWGQSTPLVKSPKFKVGSKVRIPKLDAEPLTAQLVRRPIESVAPGGFAESVRGG